MYAIMDTQKETVRQTEMGAGWEQLPMAHLQCSFLFQLGSTLVTWAENSPSENGMLKSYRTTVCLHLWEVFLGYYCISGMFKVLLYRLDISGPLFVVWCNRTGVWNSMILALSSSSTSSINVLVDWGFLFVCF